MRGYRFLNRGRAIGEGRRGRWVSWEKGSSSLCIEGNILELFVRWVTIGFFPPFFSAG